MSVYQVLGLCIALLVVICIQLYASLDLYRETKQKLNDAECEIEDLEGRLHVAWETVGRRDATIASLKGWRTRRKGE